VNSGNLFEEGEVGQQTEGEPREKTKNQKKDEEKAVMIVI